MEPTEAARAYHDFDEYATACKFRGCLHDSEPHCAVKEAVDEGKISKERYEHYLTMLKELKEKRRNDMVKVAPSLLSANFACLKDDIEKSKMEKLIGFIMMLWMDILYLIFLLDIVF